MGDHTEASPHARPLKSVESGFAFLFAAACVVLVADQVVAWEGVWSVVAIGLGVLSATLGLGIFPRISLDRHDRTSLIYFAVQLLIGIAIFSLSHAGGMFFLLLIVGQAVRVLPIGWVVAAAIPMPFLHAGMADRADAIRNIAIFFAALVLTIGFSWVVERERRARAELHLAHQRLSAYAAQAEELAVTRERNRMAREFHDTLAQGFTGILLQIEAVDSALETSQLDRARQRLDNARLLARDSLAEARRSVWSLRPMVLEYQGLPGAVRDAVRALAVDDGPAVRFRTGGAPRPLDPELEADLLRVAQEAVTNAAKHAGAANVALELLYGPASVELRVSDDGGGFQQCPAAGRPDGSGFGLTAMRERLARHGGELGIQSTPGTGTRLVARVELPVANQTAHV